MKSRIKVVNLVLALLVIISVSTGWLYINYSGSVLSYNFGVRALVIIFLLVIVSISYIAFIGKRWLFPSYAVIFYVYFLYTVCIAIARGEVVSTISPALRQTIYIAVFLIAYYRSRDAKATLCFLFCFLIFEAFISLYFDRGVYINGMWRLGGSIGSASGYAGLFFIIFITSLIFTYESSKSWFVLAALAIVVIYLTGSRSVFFFSLLVLLGCMFFKLTMIWRLLFAIVTLSSTTFLLSSIESFSLFGRFVELSQGKVDNSTLYRLFILKTYLINVTLNEVLFGLGLNAFPNWFFSKTGDADVAPHIELLTIFIEGGLLGSLLFTWGAMSFYLNVRKCHYTNFGLKLLLWSAPVGAFMFLNPWYFTGAMILWAYCSAVVLSERRRCHGRLQCSLLKKESKQS